MTNKPNIDALTKGKGVKLLLVFSMGAAFVIAIFTASSGGFPTLLDEPAVPYNQLRPTASGPNELLLIEDGHAIVVVNAPDGPTLETRNALEQARNLGAKLLTIRLQMTGLTQDEELMELIRKELADLAGQYGFTGEKYRLVECLEVCE